MIMKEKEHKYSIDISINITQLWIAVDATITYLHCPKH